MVKISNTNLTFDILNIFATRIFEDSIFRKRRFELYLGIYRPNFQRL
jgi:hypothetical protein